MLQIINRTTNNLWSNLDLPELWGNSKLKTLWKGNRSKSGPGKYRRLSIESAVSIVIINIILEQLRPWYEAQLSEEQNRFWRNRSTTDRIYSVKNIFISVICQLNSSIRIPRKWLSDTIRLRFPEGENVKLFDILGKFYQKRLK